jgi:hypothetical protein
MRELVKEDAVVDEATVTENEVKPNPLGQSSIVINHATESLTPKMKWLTFYAIAVGFGV